MDLTTFLKAEEIVKELRQVQQMHESYQDAISGSIEKVTISTENGNIDISDKEIINEIIFLIDSKYYNKEKKLQEKLESID